MFASLFKTAEVDKYADWIVEEIKRALPPGFDPNMRNVAERAEELNQRITKHVQSFTSGETFGLYKKARLTARVREGMTALGYPEPFVKALSIDLIKRIQLASKAAKR